MVKNKKLNKKTTQLINDLSETFNAELSKKQQQIDNLIKENTDLKNKLNEKEVSFSDIKEDSKLIMEQANSYYDLTVDKLKKISNKWESFFNELSQKYPVYPVVKQSLEIKKNVDVILNQNNNSIDKIESALNDNNNSDIFNPKQIINEYISVASDNGFNMDEVLNPGKLELEDLCKELGMIEDE